MQRYMSLTSETQSDPGTTRKKYTTRYCALNDGEVEHEADFELIYALKLVSGGVFVNTSETHLINM